jgi:hypothetical protein
MVILGIPDLFYPAFDEVECCTIFPIFIFVVKIKSGEWMFGMSLFWEENGSPR